MSSNSKTKSNFTNELTQRMVDFVTSIGISVKQTILEDGLPIPGISVQNGEMLIDEERLSYPGDILYQAGRIAILPMEERNEYVGKDHPEYMTEATQGMMAMCWAWAALTHLQIAPEVVFHNGGYKGQSMQIIHGYQSGSYMGLPMLQLYEMAYEQHQAYAKGLNPFPYMYKWVNN